MGVFPDLPSILAWEISLALLVLASSLLRLRTRRAGRTRAGARAPSRRLRAAFVGLGFALAAASFTYAMPDLPAPEGSTRTSSQRLRAAADKARDFGDGASTRRKGVSGPERTSAVPPTLPDNWRGRASDEAQVSGALEAAGRVDPSPDADVAKPTPEATGSPTPEPTALPTVTPAAEPTQTPTP